MITAQRLLTELGNRAWSGFNIDDMVWGNDDAQTAQTELNIALRYLVNLVDFPFKSSTQKLNTRAGKASYGMPDGAQIVSIRDESQKKLVYYGNGETLDKTLTGTPTGYYINYSNPDASIKLYPIPDDSYQYTITYNSFYPVLDNNDELQMEFTAANDYMNLPESLEFLFMDCLVLRTMAQNNKDQEDENYVPTLNEFNEYWKLFKKKANPVKTTTYLRV